ncbi:MAG: DUF3570 domain-containing protein, partial [Gammaproteobacteria bacterium]|nr:DUF3570 domain-containing protein [Gammaproteobacteria bacterium]
VSADYRLSSLATATVGIGWGQKYFKDLQVNVRGEFMYQWYIASELNALQAVSVQGSLYYQF